LQPVGDRASEADAGQEVGCLLIVASCNAPPILEPIEGALDDVAHLVGVGIVWFWLFAIGLGRYDGFAAVCSQITSDIVCIIGFVAEEARGCGDACQQATSTPDIVNLAARQQQGVEPTELVTQRMDFGSRAAAGAADRLFLRPPCILALPATKQSASLSVDGSPQPPRVSEPEKKQGAPSIGSSANPNSRLGRKPSPHLQGRVMERHPASLSFVGIDVSKDRLDVHVRPSGQTFAVTRDGKGLEELVDDLRTLVPVLIVLEATGGFEITVAAALAGAGLPLAIVNPRQIRDFARATGRLAKTDTLDAEVIALFAERIRPEPRPLGDADSQSLAELIARRRQVVEMLGMETIGSIKHAILGFNACSRQR